MTLEAPDWLNAEFMQKVLRSSKKDESIEVKNVATKAATAKGDNYMSDMFRAAVEYSRNKSGQNVTEKISLIVKMAPSSEGHKELVAKGGLFTTEIEMMETTLDKMNRLLNEGEYRLGARVFYTETGASPFLVVEDLAPLGFRVADRQAGLDLPHCIFAMRGLAKFHASSVALCEKDPKVGSKYNKGIFHADQPQEMSMLFITGMKSLAKEVANWKELGPGYVFSRDSDEGGRCVVLYPRYTKFRANFSINECSLASQRVNRPCAHSYSEKIMKLSDVSWDKAGKAGKRKEDEFNVINHGDFWVNNMLFRYNDEGKVTDHIFVDFQLCSWTSPAIDILYFLNTSPSETVLVNHRDALLEEYMNTLTKTMARIGCTKKPPSMAALEKSLKEREFYGLFAACTILPYVLLDKSEATSVEEIMAQAGAGENPAYKGKQYRKTMLRRLPEWNAKGLLDV